LCSVSDQYLAVNEIKRLLKTGGCFGWVEQVAVDLENDNNSINQVTFDLEQKLLDPLQQVVAHNCHLHRQTVQIIEEVFEPDAHFLESERFFIQSMWPISCQASGVVKVLYDFGTSSTRIRSNLERIYIAKNRHVRCYECFNEVYCHVPYHPECLTHI
jgi:hypothetical protein